jgi:predicted permease
VIDGMRRDVAYGFRLLRRTPVFTATALITLAVAVAINVAVFAVVDAALLKPLPFPDPQRLILVSRTARVEGRTSTDTSVDGRTWELVRDRATALDAAPFSSWTSGVNLVVPSADAAQARFVHQERVGAGFFHVLGVAPILGREFTRAEDIPGGPALVVISADLWTALFDRNPAVIGQTVTLRGEPHTIVGVMPDGFRTDVEADLWTPIQPSTKGQGGAENYQILGRLRPGVVWAQAASDIENIGRAYAETRTDRIGDVSFSIQSLQEGLTAQLKQPLLMLWLAVAVVLVVASVNLAGLFLARAAGRSREIATRLALGSGRWAVARQLVIESALLALAGGVAGLLLGSVALDGLRWLARDVLDFWQPLTFGLRTGGVALLLSLLACLMFGLWPAVHAARLDIQAGFAAGSARGTAGPATRWPRRAMVLVQVSLGVVLLVGAGLLVRTYGHLIALDPGFDPSHVVTASISLEDARYRTVERTAAMFDRTLERLRGAPGVQGAAVSLGLPYERLLNLGFRLTDGSGDAVKNSRMTSVTYVSDGYFDAIGVPIRRGRGFGPGDHAGSLPVVVVSETFVKTYFAGQEPIGRHVALGSATREIVGVAGDVQVRPGWGHGGPLASMPLTYVPVTQISDSLMNLVHGWFSPAFIVRSGLPQSQAASLMRQALDEVDPLLPFARVRAIGEVQAQAVALVRLLMLMLTILSLTAVGLVIVGIHGLIAASVAERTREMGIRLALGSTMSGALRSLFVPGLVIAGVGTVCGLALAAAGARLLQGFVWGVGTHDAATYASVAALMLVVAAISSVIPALRILRLDPAVTLRQE